MRTAVLERNAELNGIKADFNSGLIRGYSGTRPTDADMAAVSLAAAP